MSDAVKRETEKKMREWGEVILKLRSYPEWNKFVDFMAAVNNEFLREMTSIPVTDEKFEKRVLMSRCKMYGLGELYKYMDSAIAAFKKGGGDE